jgi:predicted dehydrogenase
VLCEKPFAMNAKQARRMLQAATDTGNRLIEAFHDRYHPLSLELDAIKASGRLGDILSVAANFSSALPFDPKSLRHDPALGGGGLMDLGCYPVHWLRAFTGEEPTITSAEATLNPMGADITIVASMTFPSGSTGELITLMEHDTEFVQTLDVVGTEGTMHVDGMIFPSRGHSIQVTIDGLVTESTVGGLSTYDHQLDAIVRGLASGEQLLTEGEDSFATMAVIDAIYAAAGLSRDFD